MARKSLFTVGMRGAKAIGFAQTLRSGSKVVTVEWREPGTKKRASRSWPLTAEGRRLARAHAEGTAERLSRVGVVKVDRLTLASLFTRFRAANEHTWRPSTRTSYLARWAIFENIVGAGEFADLVTQETLDDVRMRLRTTKRAKTGEPMAPNQIREILARVCGIWRWAKRRKLLADNPLADYENAMGKDEGKLKVPEYTPDEYARILRVLDPTAARFWRAYGVIALAGLTGKRERALLELQWPAIDVAGRLIRWSSQTDKVGKEWVQPMADDTVTLLALLWAWREKIGYTGPYVFPSAHSRNRVGHYTADALTKALHEAEKRAGVTYVKYRAIHSVKRYVVRDLYEKLGGDLIRVGRFVGNTNLKVLEESYLRERVGELKPVAAAIALPRTEPKALPAGTNERRTDPDTPATSPANPL
jgi:integrase